MFRMAAEKEAHTGAAANGWASQKAFSVARTTDTQQDPIFSPGSNRAAMNKRRMSMQDTIDVSKIDRHMYLDRFGTNNRPPKIIIENQDGEIQLPESVRSNTPEQPFIEFSLQHDTETSILTVFIARTSNLHELVNELKAHYNCINPFCKVQLMPASSVKGSKQSQTGKVHKNMWAPTFAEQFAIGVEQSELDARTLAISIYHDDCLASANRHSPSPLPSPDFCIGHILVPLANVKLEQLVQLRREIKAGESTSLQQPPVILLGISYLPTAERLTINVSKVSNLLNSKTTSVLVKIAVLDESNLQLKGKGTSIAKVSEQCAHLNETLNFNLPKRPIDAVKLRVTLFQYRGLFPFRKRLDVSSLDFGCSTSQKNSEAAQHWQDMLTGKDSKTPRWHTMDIAEATLKKR